MHLLKFLAKISTKYEQLYNKGADVPVAITGFNQAPQASSFLGKAGVVLDTLRSSMINLGSRGYGITILAFEVANTIAKGANLLQTLSKENIRFLKEEILHSEGVQQLVSQDVEELLCIAAADKRKEFDVFSREVVRFGNICKDPQWHNLGRFFKRFDSDLIVHRQFREEAERTMQELTTLAQHTSELYHELNALDRSVQHSRRKLEEVESLLLSQRGESLKKLRSEIKHRRIVVRNLKKKSLWSKSMDQVMEKLVDIFILIHQAISEAFGHNGLTVSVNDKMERLGVAGLASHYAKTITQIDDIVFHATSLPPNMRDTLYNGLPSSVKTVLCSWVRRAGYAEELTVPQIKVEMEVTLQWLVPVAKNTIIAHQGIGSIGEWANTGLCKIHIMTRRSFSVPFLFHSKDFGKMTGTHSSLIRLQTLYHADKQKMDMCILELLMLLHRLIGRVRFGDITIKSPTQRG
ncbi:hypothetical protein RJ639_017318 [Escallonia herrerae]|uniref:Uncharacterized protein n=1 Tax=Escallonia herrerae TaxID=1293975 RepID=A0AA88VF31_9ASTE|nr:hypothetical protein RJ639_017318 [Escallonia herrerae]